MSEILTDVYNNISSWILTVSGYSHCIKAEQNFTRPAYPYFTIKLSERNKIGHDFKGSPNASGEALILGDREYTLSIRGYGDGCYQKTIELDDAFENPELYDQLTALGIVVFDSNGALDVSDPVGTEYRESSSLDVLVRIDANATDTSAGVIERVEADGEYDVCGEIKTDKIIVDANS